MRPVKYVKNSVEAVVKEFSVAAVFSSNMVLQREKKIRIFGEGEEGQKVTVILKLPMMADVCERTVVKDGRWMAELPPQKACDGASVTVTCGTWEKVMTNVSIGEVWLCGGQSNMEMELQNIKEGQTFLKDPKKPRVRFYYTQKKGFLDDDFFRTEKMMCWKEFSEQDAACWSGVGYLFGKELSEKLGVTVGLIGCNWGGTSASHWMSKESLLSDRDIAVYWEEFEERIQGKSVEEQIAEYKAYEEYQKQWEEKQVKAYETNPNLSWTELQEQIGPCRWPGPLNARNPLRPAGLYECMLLRVAPYTLRGVIFYQGESDDHRPRTYAALFGRMIAQWRKVFLEPVLPFLFVQLPMHRYEADPDYKHWCLIREAQMDVYQTIKGTGIAVAIDSGDFNDIHPKDKRQVAHRLCLQALGQVYGALDETEYMGPVYRDYVVKGSEIELYFDYAGDGFYYEGEKPVGFEIAGEDKQFVTAEAEISGDRIVVSAKQVENPCYVRYLWTNYGDVNLYGRNGIPVAPFRTRRDDEAEIKTVKVEIQQNMEVG